MTPNKAMTPKSERTTQAQEILAHLQRNGEISQLEAFREYGCWRLASRISDLKKAGYAIGRRMEQYVNGNGRTVQYAVYTYEAEVGA